MAKKNKNKKGYLNLNLGWIVNLILAIFPVTSWILGGLTRIKRGHLIAGILQLCVIGEIFFYFADLITVILSGDLKFFA
ncbi:MAG TPA: hypothetical protein IAC70_04440 [Candidatus Faecicola pullistercoris]|nr:hypothetical protein [Candidatus Faecicola pullistercoris]